MQTPYIGITDFTSSEQSWNLIQCSKDFYWNKYSSNLRMRRKLMVGVMMSYKTLHNIESKWTSIFPKKTNIQRIFVSSPDVLNTLHYADYEGHTALADLLEATQFGGPHLNAIQLDMIWPDYRLIRQYKQENPDIKIILQINTPALEQRDNDPKKTSEFINTYSDSLDYVLLDKSGGKGLPMNPEILRPYLDQIAEDHPQLGLAVAGGLGPTTVDLVKSLISDFPHLSIDAQGRLRPSGNAMDPIDWSLAETYVDRALAMFQFGYCR